MYVILALDNAIQKDDMMSTIYMGALRATYNDDLASIVIR